MLPPTPLCHFFLHLRSSCLPQLHPLEVLLVGLLVVKALSFCSSGKCPYFAFVLEIELCHYRLNVFPQNSYFKTTGRVLGGGALCEGIGS